MRALTLTGGVVVAAVLAVGCSDQTQQRAREAGEKAAAAARTAGEAAQSAAQDAVNNAEDARDTVAKASQARGAVNEAAGSAGAALQTAQVKAALIADTAVKAADINVDTDAHTKTIILKGHVPSAAQKTAAERIAIEKASTGYTVRNELVVP